MKKTLMKMQNNHSAHCAQSMALEHPHSRLFSLYSAGIFVLLSLFLSTPSFANDDVSATTDDSSELVSDIYGGKEAPLDMNIMPWQRTTAKLTKPEITSSILERIMKPIDRTSLKRELDFVENSSE